MVNAAKEKIGPKDAVEMARDMATLAVAKGRKVVTLALSSQPSDEEITKLIIGPSGNLRAPTWKRGRTLVVGFNEEMYDDVLG